MKIRVSHYKNSEKELFINGGCLYCKDEKLILKSFFRRIVEFGNDEVKIRNLPDEMLFKTVEISDNKKSYVLLLTKANYFKLCEIAKI